MHAHAGSLRDLSPQQRRERLDPCLIRVDAQLHRKAGGDSEADLASEVALSVFEPVSIIADDISIGVVPGGRFKIDKGWFEPPDRIAPHVQKARAPWSAQIFAAWGRQHVAADVPYVDRELADRLAGIE